MKKSCLALLALATILPACIVSANEATTSEPDRPNILFVFSDDHACHAIGAYDGWLKEVNPTPNIDQLASQGMLFKNSFCTNSICGPSRAVILTGKFSHLNGFMSNGNQFDGSQQTFPKLMRKSGYQTAMIGKWHLRSEPQGFDYWDILQGQGDYYNPVLLNKDGKRTVEGYCTDIVTDLAVDWLKENAKSDKPFMLMCQHKAPHRCWMPPARHLQLYNDIEMPIPETLFDKQEDNAKCIQLEEMEVDRYMNLVGDLFSAPNSEWLENSGRSHDTSGLLNLKKMTPDQLAAWNQGFEAENKAMVEANLSGQALVRWKYNRYIKNYLRCVRGVDDSVGQLMQYLEDNDLSKNTIVIYCSDQGFYLGDHGWYDKRFMYEESLKMPLIVKWPGQVSAGSVNKNLVQNVDYAETFLEIAGAKVPDDMQGRSLVPLLKGEQVSDWRDSIYYHYYAFSSVHMVPQHYGVRDDRYKLIHFYQFDEWEFYDLKTDPDELTNQYANAEYQDEISRMKTKVKQLQEQYKDDSDISAKPAEWKEQFYQRANAG